MNRHPAVLVEHGREHGGADEASPPGGPDLPEQGESSARRPAVVALPPRLAPSALTDALHAAGPPLAAVDWALRSVEPGATTSLLPLNRVSLLPKIGYADNANVRPIDASLTTMS
jgi:hypothetical protein